jgi:hypothetical protein
MRVSAWIIAVLSLPLGMSCALFGAYFAWKFFALYLPNKAAVDECVPSGGTCSIDGMANLEISGGMTLLFVGIAALCFVASFFGVSFLMRTRRSKV